MTVPAKVAMRANGFGYATGTTTGSDVAISHQETLFKQLYLIISTKQNLKQQYIQDISPP